MGAWQPCLQCSNACKSVIHVIAIPVRHVGWAYRCRWGGHSGVMQVMLSKHEARAMQKSSGHHGKYPERSKYLTLMTYLAGEPDPAKRRATGRLRARALGYQFPSNVKEMMARQ